MNKYGLPFSADSTQTILPALTEDGVVKGWYPIVQTVFDGTETSFTLPDVTVPLKTVTVDTPDGTKQYMAAVFPEGLPFNSQPWASSSLVKAEDGYYRWWSLPTESWVLHYGTGVFLDGLMHNLDRAGAAAVPAPSAPTVATPQARTWQASIAYAMLNGNCPFFDFNWVQQFTASGETKPLRIEVLTSPSPLLAKVVGILTATQGGVLYDTIRVLKTGPVATGLYVFTFKVYEEHGLSSNVTLNLTVA